MPIQNPDFPNLPQEKSCKFAVVLNEKAETGRLMNALGHAMAGLSATAADLQDRMTFLRYEDAHGGIHPAISHFGVIVLKAKNGNQLRTLRHAAIDQGVMYNDFTTTMTVGTSEEQWTTTKHTSEEELEYLCVALFGRSEQLDPLTKKFSLFR